MNGVVSLLDPEHSRMVEDVWAELDRTFGVRGVYITPYPHFSYQVAAAYDAARLETALAEFALMVVGKKSEELLGQQKLQHGVAEKFEPLVGGGLSGMILQPGRVRDSRFEQRCVAKRVADPGLELGQRRAHELALE